MVYSNKILYLFIFTLFPASGYYGEKSPLMEAAERGDLKKIRQLVAHGADINQETEWEFLRAVGETALAFAVRFEHYQAAQLLIELGADVNGWMCWDICSDTYRTICDTKNPAAYIRAPTILEYAIANHAPIDVIKLFITAGADVNLIGFYSGHVTALMVATSMGNEEVVKLLLEAGANVDYTR